MRGFVAPAPRRSTRTGCQPRQPAHLSFELRSLSYGVVGLAERSGSEESSQLTKAPSAPSALMPSPVTMTLVFVPVAVSALWSPVTATALLVTGATG